MSKSKARTLKKKYKGGGSNELDDLIYRLSLKLPKHETELIVSKLGITDLLSFLNKTTVFGLRTATNETNKDFILNKITREADANRILSAVLGIREEIKAEEQILIGYLENAFTGKSINPRYNTSYIAMIMRTLKLTKFYDLIDVTPKDINDINDVVLPQIYKDKLLALQKSLKKKHKVLILLMNTKFLTLYEAKNLIDFFGIPDNSPETLINFSEEDVNSINKLLLSDEKKILLWEWIKSYNIYLLKTKLKKKFSNFITERIITGIERYLEKNTGKDVYGDFHTLFDKKTIPQYLELLKNEDIKRIFKNKNIKDSYDLIKLDLNSIEDPRKRQIKEIQDYFKRDKEYILNIIEGAKDSASYSSTKYSSSSKSPSSSKSSPYKRSSSSSNKDIDELLKLLEKHTM